MYPGDVEISCLTVRGPGLWDIPMDLSAGTGAPATNGATPSAKHKLLGFIVVGGFESQRRDFDISRG